MISQVSTDDSRPIIHLTTVECDVLWEVALSAEDKHPHSAAMLVAELERAVLCDPDSLPPQTVTMNSTIEFVDEGSGVRRVVQLVYPNDADIEAGRLSILTPVGAGLIGMSAGHAISWPDREGHVRFLRIDSVTPPEQV